jgi:sugar/nucleoside kinase (ribokinase family)
MDVYCVGQLAADILVRPVDSVDFGVDTRRVDGMEIKSGGDCLNAALGLARLGCSVGFAGRVGQDQLGDYLAGVIKEAGIDGRDLRRSPDAGTCSCLVLINSQGDRTFFYHGGANDLFSLEDVDLSRTAEASVVHVGGTYLLPRFDGAGAAALFRAARQKGRLTCMDVTWDTTGRWLSVIEPCLQHLSFFLPSVKEAERITGRSDPREMAAFLQDKGVETAVIKLGELGCYVKPAGAAGFFVRAFPTTVVDTTGAGDSFVAGFLTATVKGWDLERRAALGCAVAALNIRKVGATGGIPTFEQARRFMEENGR